MKAKSFKKEFDLFVAQRLDGNHKRFWSFVDKTSSDCWIWTGRLYHHGYGVFKFNKKNFVAHRVSWELVNGEIPADLQLDHLCKQRNCVNPEHLEPVTAHENKRRTRRSQCRRGHPFTKENILILRCKGKTRRACKACDSIYRHSENRKTKQAVYRKRHAEKMKIKKEQIFSGH